MKCPCCGSTVTGPQILVSLEQNVVTTELGSVVVRGKEAAILAALVQAYPRKLSRDMLINHVWDTDAPARVDACINVHICLLRKRIRPIGIIIENVWGDGYLVRMSKSISMQTAA